MEFTLNVRCTSDDTMDVTSNDLQLDPNHPDVVPVGAPLCLACYIWADFTGKLVG